MYTNFYTSSDVQLYMTNLDHSRRIKLDTAISVAYNLSQSAIPIYSLGNRKAQFFSTGNTLGHGVLTLAFTDEEALKYAISYLSEYESTNSYTSRRIGKTSSNADFIKASENSSLNTSTNNRLISIGAIQTLVNIKLYINNETLVRGSDTKIITLNAVKFTGESFQTSSSADNTLNLNYNFYFKDIERG